MLHKNLFKNQQPVNWNITTAWWSMCWNKMENGDTDIINPLIDSWQETKSTVYYLRRRVSKSLRRWPGKKSISKDFLMLSRNGYSKHFWEKPRQIETDFKNTEDHKAFHCRFLLFCLIFIVLEVQWGGYTSTTQGNLVGLGQYTYLLFNV